MVAAAPVSDSTVVDQVEYCGCLARMPVAAFGATFGAFAAKDAVPWLAYITYKVDHGAQPFDFGQRRRVLLTE